MTYRIEDARKESHWIIRGKLVHKRVFVHKDPETRRTYHLLTLTLMDRSGATAEFKSWSISKAYCVYRKVRINQSYEVSGQGQFESTNQTYSTSKYQVNNSWWIEPTEDEIKPEKFLNAATNFKRIINGLKQGPVNIVGVFYEMIEGPAKHYINGKPAVQGYFITLADDSNCLFSVLVWHTTRIDKSKFALFNCRKGDTLLIPASRLSYPYANLSKNERLQTLTTICSPVVDSGCVEPGRISDLKRRFQSAKEFNKILAL